MDGYLLSYAVEWLNLLGRWLHLITGIAWIGASFYFIWLDNNIQPPPAGSALEKQGVAGELWAIHGGGFYNPQKYLVAPKELPQHLHWFKWEAYATWLSGFAMLWIVYYFNASSMMTDPALVNLSSGQAIAIGLSTLLGGWIVYDLLCRSPLGKRPVWFGIVIYVLIVMVAYLLSQTLSGRAAYIHIGAMIGTIMVGNVLMVIVPGQKKMVDAMRQGTVPDPLYGQRGKQRSVHNNYFTLPVVFLMISNHYAMTYNQRYGWLVMAAIILAGVLFRHYFNLRHKGRNAWHYPVAGLAILAAVAIAIAPGRPSKAAAAQPAPDFSKVQAIIAARCVACHAEQPTQPGFAAAPAGVMLQKPELIRQHAAKVYSQTVQLKSMPIGNLTGMTDEERSIIAAWYENGAR